MDFIARDTTDDGIGDGTLLEFCGPAELCRVGTGYRAIIDKDHRSAISIDTMGRLMTGDGKVLDDVVADITVDGQRFGMIQCVDGQFGPQWRVNGPPYNEKFAPL